MQPKLADILTDASLLAGWTRVRANQGGPGVDGETIAGFEQHLMNNLATLRNEVLYETYRPKPLLRVEIPKKTGGKRALAIPAVRDRVLQSAVAIALTPIFEAEFEDVSFAYRRGRSVDQAAARVSALRNQGYRWVVDADIRAFFDQVDHQRLLTELRRLVFDEDILYLVQLWLNAKVQQGKRRLRLKKGIPQGSPLSPMLANLYLDRLDEILIGNNRKLVRYADDFLILCKSRKAAEDALELTEEVLQALRLQLNDDKTRIVDFNQGFRFLGVQYIRSLAFKLKHAEPVHTVVSSTVAERPESPPVPETPQTTLALAFAQAGIDAEDFPTGSNLPSEQQDPAPAAPPDSAQDYRLDPRLRTLYLLKHGQVLGKESERFSIRRKNQPAYQIPAIKVDQIMVFGNAQITTQAMHFCLAERIPVYLLSSSGRFQGVIDSFGTEPVMMHKAQFQRAEDPEFCLDTARAMVRGKINNNRSLLRRLARKHPSDVLQNAIKAQKRILNQLNTAGSLEQIRGFEGNAARINFATMKAILPSHWGFDGRKRQPPPDPINAMLSWGYTNLFYNMYSFLRARGLNPHIGCLHPIRAGHPALASDLMEEFRAPVVDAIVWNLALNNRLTPADFTLPGHPGEGCRLKRVARMRVIRELEKKYNTPIKHPESGLKLDYRRCMEHQVNLFAAVIQGRKPNYIPFTIK